MSYNNKSKNVLDEFKNLSAEEVKKRIRYNSFSVAAFNTRYNINVGCICRSAHVFGAQEFVIVGKRQWDRRASVGSHNYHKSLIYLKTTDEFISWAYNNKKVPVLVDYIPNKTVPINIISKYPDNCVFVFGPEVGEIPKELYLIPDIPKIHIPMFGATRSLNVANAASIIMYDWLSKNYFKREDYL